MWNSEADELVPPVNSELLAKALRDNGIPHEYVRYKTGAHGIGLGTGTECEGWFELAVAFWEQNRKQMGDGMKKESFNKDWLFVSKKSEIKNG